jgi:hypothetical protein
MLVEISSGEKMKPILIAGILLLFLLFIPMTLAFQQSVQAPKTMLSKPGFDFGFVACGAIDKSTEPGSGGGGQGVI